MAFLAQLKELGDVVLFDIAPTLGAAKALDINHSNAVGKRSLKCTGSNKIEDIANSDVCIITAGLARLPSKDNEEWSRDDLIEPNSKIISSIAENIKNFAPDALVICITNPMDVMVHLIKKITGFPKNKVVGMGGLLDSSRMCFYIAEILGVDPRNVHGSVIGAHGDAMVPLVKQATVNGIPLKVFLDEGKITKEDLDQIVFKTINAGAEVLKLYGSGSSYFAPANAAIEMAEAYLKDKKSVIVCSCYLEGEYGFNDVYLGTPCIIGAGGVEKVIEIPLDNEERVLLSKSFAEIRRLEAFLK